MVRRVPVHEFRQRSQMAHSSSILLSQMYWLTSYHHRSLTYYYFYIIESTHVENWICAQTRDFLRPMPSGSHAGFCVVISIVLKIYDNFRLGSMCDINEVHPSMPYAFFQWFEYTKNEIFNSNFKHFSIRSMNKSYVVHFLIFSAQIYAHRSSKSEVHHFINSDLDANIAVFIIYSFGNAAIIDVEPIQSDAFDSSHTKHART